MAIRIGHTIASVGFGALLAVLGVSVLADATEPDCDGSTPLTDWCGTKVVCKDPVKNPQTGNYYCPNHAIEQQFIQFKCNPGPGSGSTLCGTVTGTLVCTIRKKCEFSELQSPTDPNTVTPTCAVGLQDQGKTNSNASPTDYITCKDTTKG